MELKDLSTMVRTVNDAKLEGLWRNDRQAYAQFIAWVDKELRSNGWTWEQMSNTEPEYNLIWESATGQRGAHRHNGSCKGYEEAKGQFTPARSDEMWIPRCRHCENEG